MVEETPNPAEGAAAGGANPGVEAQRRLEVLHQVARSFAHDFKNPLSALLLGLQRLGRLADPARAEQARALATRLESTIQSMTRLVDGLADLARHQGGVLQLETSRRSAAELIARALEPLRTGAAERRQHLVLEVVGELPEVEWDAERVIRALHHLLSRALQVAPEGGTVRCTASTAGGRVVVSVEGGGLPASRAPVPASPGSDRPLPGDLAVLFARALAEAHGGSLTEEALGSVTRFLFALPIAPEAGR